MNEQQNGQPNILWKLIIFFIIASLIILQIVDFNVLGDTKDVDMIKNTSIRFLGGFLFLIMLKFLGYDKMFRFGKIKHAGLLITLAFLVALNNFPMIATIDNRASLTEPIYRVVLFFVESLSVGFFEEIIFRGIILTYLLNLLFHKKNGLLLAIIVSSIIFGIVHFFNLLAGASLTDTLLQVGYSTLVGMMWAVIYLRTKNLWIVMILHATFNFFGQVMFYLGSVVGRYDVYTILITVVLAVITAYFSYKVYLDLDKKSTFL